MGLLGTVIGGAVGGPGGVALSLLGNAKAKIGRAVDWATANTAHLLLALLVASNGAWFIKDRIDQHHAANWHQQADHEHKARQDDQRTWVWVDRTNHGTIDFLIATLDGQSRMIRAWAATADGKQKAAQAALRAATARGARAEGLAQRIDAERGSGCKSGAAVIAAKGEL